MLKERNIILEEEKLRRERDSATIKKLQEELEKKTNLLTKTTRGFIICKI